MTVSGIKAYIQKTADYSPAVARMEFPGTKIVAKTPETKTYRRTLTVTKTGYKIG
ncbi:MAG: hypothetical protein SPG61_05610 [Arcanobacterium sp.]|nr:hypothetical protein [Arcanobacterium sp.]